MEKGVIHIHELPTSNEINDNDFLLISQNEKTRILKVFDIKGYVLNEVKTKYTKIDITDFTHNHSVNDGGLLPISSISNLQTTLDAGLAKWQ